jgi:hypothetical protein
MNLLEWQDQVEAGREANIHKASFIERRLFYLNGHLSWRVAPGQSAPTMTTYKGTQ